METAKGEAKK
jgi:hypothetical protein